MKTIYFLITFVLFHCLNLLGQVEATEVVSGLNGSYGVAVHGNDLYVTELLSNKISKVDLTANTPVATDFITEGLASPNGLIVYGNDLYISEYSGENGNNNRILKVDLTAVTPVATELVGGLTNLELMAIHENDLYVSQRGSNNIVKIDLTAETPSAIEVVSVVNPTGLAVYENELYITEDTDDNFKIVKIDLTAETPAAIEVVSVGFSTGLAVYGDELYITEDGNDKIVKIDLTVETPVLTDVLTTGLVTPWQLVVAGDILYIGDVGGDNSYEGKVLKLDLTTLSVADIPTELSNIGISPNPASDFLQVSGLKAREKYAIYNVLGAEIRSGEVFNNEEIDIRSLSKGLYFLKLESNWTYQLIKEETK